MPWVTAFSTSGCSSRGGTGHAARGFLEARLEAEAGTEPHLLDGQEALGQGQLVSERDAVPRAQGQAAPQEIAEHDAGPPRGFGIAADERDHGVEAVEEEVRMELGAEGLQLGFARQHLVLEGSGSPRAATSSKATSR